MSKSDDLATNIEPFSHLTLTVTAFAKARTVAMGGEPNDTANALMHALALFLATNSPSPEQARKDAEDFAAKLPDLSFNYANTQKDLADA